MSLDLDLTVDLSLAKPVTLARMQWHVVPLPLRQVIAIGAILPKMRGITPDNIAETSFDPALEVIERALKKAYPGITKDDLLDLPIGLDELMEAIPVIVEQSGGKRADPAAGEA